MALRPTGLPRWATSPTGSSGVGVTEPTEDKKDQGWVANEKPAAAYLNWLNNATYNWLSYLDPAAVSTEDWLGLSIDSGSVVVATGNTTIPGTIFRSRLQSASGTSGTYISANFISAGASAPFIGKAMNLNSGKASKARCEVTSSEIYSLPSLGDVSPGNVFRAAWWAELDTGGGMTAHQIAMGLFAGMPATGGTTGLDASTTTVMFEKPATASGTWRTITRGGGVNQITDTGIIVKGFGGVPQHFAIEVNSSKSTAGVAAGNVPIVKFYIDGVLAASHTTGTAAATLFVGYSIYNAATAADPALVVGAQTYRFYNGGPQ